MDAPSRRRFRQEPTTTTDDLVAGSRRFPAADAYPPPRAISLARPPETLSRFPTTRAHWTLERIGRARKGLVGYSRRLASGTAETARKGSRGTLGLGLAPLVEITNGLALLDRLERRPKDRRFVSECNYADRYRGRFRFTDRPAVKNPDVSIRLVLLARSLVSRFIKKTRASRTKRDLN